MTEKKTTKRRISCPMIVTSVVVYKPVILQNKIKKFSVFQLTHQKYPRHWLGTEVSVEW